MKDAGFGRGLASACLAFTLWGLLPLYWKLLVEVNPLHILTLRIILSLVMVGGLLLIQGNRAWLTIFGNPRKAGLLLLTSILICCNWTLYIIAVTGGRTIEASLGYYINPLFSILLALIFLRERLRRLQWIALSVAFLGVLLLTVLSGVLPWISLGLALTFGLYGLLKKKIELSALESLGAETLVSLPIGIALSFVSFAGDSAGPTLAGPDSLAYLLALPPRTMVVLAFSGVATALPLCLFAAGVKRLPLSTVGFVNFIGPTIQFLIGLFVFGEAFPSYYLASYGLIWIAVVLYVISLRKTS